MRIAVIGPIYSDSFAKCIVHTLLDMGHEVLSIDVERTMFSRYLSESLFIHNFLRLRSIETVLVKAFPAFETYKWRKAINQTKIFEPDIILSVIWDIPTEILESLKHGSGREPVAAMWCPDPLTNFQRQYIFVTPWDFLFFKDRYIVELFENKLQLNAHLLPLACYPKWHFKVELTPDEKKIYGCDITTAGSLYYYRTKFLENFMRYQVKIWGPPPSVYIKSPILKFAKGRYAGELEKAKAFNGAAIVLNNMHYGEILGLNQRVFDACGCGAFQIVDASPVMEEYFIPGQELVCFRDLKELQELIPYYLNRPQERAEIAQAGYLRAHAEHTFQHRLKKMLQIMAKGKSGNDRRDNICT
jgi:spore maturation protein CgeB